MHAGAAERDPTVFEATISYVDPTAPIGGINDVEREKSSFTLIRRPMTIRSARETPERFGIERTGFTWLNRPTAMRDFADEAEVQSVYLPESAALVKELTGADLVLVFGHIQRDGALKPPSTPRSTTPTSTTMWRPSAPSPAGCCRPRSTSGASPSASCW